MGGQRVMGRQLGDDLRGGLRRDALGLVSRRPFVQLRGRSAIDTAPATRPAGPAVNMGPRARVARDRHESVGRAQHRRPKPTGHPCGVGFDGVARIAGSSRVARTAR